MQNKPASMIDMLGEALKLVGEIIRGELDLAKAEMSEKLQQAQKGLVMIALAALLGLTALMLFAATLVLTLIAMHLHPALAALGVTTVFFVAAVLLLVFGARALKPANLVPRKTLGHLAAPLSFEEKD